MITASSGTGVLGSGGCEQTGSRRPPSPSRPQHRRPPAADAYFDLIDSDDDAMARQLGGHPDQIQGDMTTELSIVTNGIFAGDAAGWQDPRGQSLGEQRHTWRLLFQLASDDSAAMMWGDLGYLYFWMQDEALAARAYDTARMILQCS